MNDPKDASVTSDNDETRNYKRCHKQSSFTASAVRIFQN